MAEHFLVVQLKFVRSEFVRCLNGVTDEEARRRFEPMNCISWMVAHLADQENRYWNLRARGIEIHPELNELAGFKKPASAPPLEDMWKAWKDVTKTADAFLETLTPDRMQTKFILEGKPVRENIGTMLLRNMHHYWFHCGEAYAIRQLLGHRDLPTFVGDMTKAKYFKEQ